MNHSQLSLKQLSDVTHEAQLFPAAGCCVALGINPEARPPGLPPGLCFSQAEILFMLPNISVVFSSNRASSLQLLGMRSRM